MLFTPLLKHLSIVTLASHAGSVWRVTATANNSQHQDQ